MTHSVSSFLFPTYLGRSKEAQCGPGVMALALGSRDPGFKSRSDHSLNVPGSPWFNFPAALVNSQLLCLRPVASLWERSIKCRKIPKISPGAYIFQRPFSKGLFLEGLIFGGAYLRREIAFPIDWASLIVGSKFTVFVLLCI